MIKYVFFDLDETLIDIKKAQNLAIESLYYKYEFNNKTDLSSFVKKWDELTNYHYRFYTEKQISYEEQRRRRITDLFKAFEMPLTYDSIEIYDIYLKNFEHSWSLFYDVKQSLLDLKNNNYILGLISNGDFNQQTQKMRKVGIFELFDFVNTSSQFQYSKPNPRVFDIIFKMHNIDFNEVCYVGDCYEKDILPCRELGIKGVLIDRKGVDYNDSELIQINTLAKLLPTIQNIK